MIEEIQRGLRQAGYQVNINGVWDENTQRAWVSWCLFNNYPTRQPFAVPEQLKQKPEPVKPKREEKPPENTE